MASTAGPEGATVGYSCEEWNGEYLLINEAAAAAAYPNSTNNVAVEVQDSMTVHCGSLDSGYEGKMSRTCSPSDAEGKENQTPAAQGGVVREGAMREAEEEGEEEEEWCIVEEGEKERPQGLYGYRYIDYDDQEAEGNIHITDDDL